jgi:predicted kinase
MKGRLMAQIFIQMSGAPGAGKTTIAKAVAPRIGAVIIDHDISKTALLDADVPASIAGKASYGVLVAIARQLLKQGHSVIFDSPCFYEELLQRGQQLAQEVMANYLYIECVVEDLDVLNRRLEKRHRLRSQVIGVGKAPVDVSENTEVSESVFRDWIANMKRPDGVYLVLDTTRPLELCVAKAIAYIENGIVR